ncbi:hypothetical protein AKJ66_01765 [candidate division MSBL1 archaeon SCGC-AAA259E22]|uniref:FAD dependent oxidoreductase domain-containing protein n=2 Tax=candidate division MSBL1 TaxID=215777 RepID=A0A133U8I0_9EURY|nr:hypothetical protein AKJ61_00565 [candidate division MSBL1 archaeon SCGC-AAA259B11]KXA93554.1 hypothetical protein AKJ66_01765 [candidate division MSBL1 archaeon SCGC-AAA259E22]
MKGREIVIIGGGITGLSTAYYLSKEGHENVVVLEKEYVGSGSTGRCAAGIREQHPDEPTIKMARESKKLWDEMAEDLGFEFRRTGYLYLLYSNEEVERYKKMKELQNSLGANTRILSPEEIKQISEYINVSDVKAGSYNPEDGQVHPFDAIHELRSYLNETDIEVEEWTEVENIKLNRRNKVVVTSDENYKTDIIVNATGGWAPKIGEMMNIDIPVEPHKHQAIITEPFERDSIKPMVISMKYNGAYLFQIDRDGGILAGAEPAEEIATYDQTGTLRFERRVSEALPKFVPAMKHLKILRHWAGFYAMTEDTNPLIGEYKIDGHYLVTGGSGHGYQLGPIVGKSLTELILEGGTDMPLDYYDPYRIERREYREPSVQPG